MTTEELFNKYKSYTALTEGYYGYLVDKEGFKEALVEFAKCHVEQALEKASENARIINWKEHGGEDVEIVKESILEAYPLENIK